MAHIRDIRLIPLVYDHLRALAGKLMRGRDPGYTLQPTGLVHEAYLRLQEQRLLNWQDRHHFFHIAARVMRRRPIGIAPASTPHLAARVPAARRPQHRAGPARRRVRACRVTTRQP